MILGISVLKDRLLLSVHHGPERDADYNTYLFGEFLPEDPESGTVWEMAGDSAGKLLKEAEKAVVSVPASIGFLKRLELDSIGKSNKEYLSWLAQIELPGDPALFYHQFLPHRESFDSARTELLFFASPAERINKLLTSLEIGGDSSNLILIPEQLGLVQTIERSLAREDIPQAGIVSCDKAGTAAVYIRDGRFNHGRYFKFQPDMDMATDIETYYLSRADGAESLPLVITGFPSDFKTNWTPVVPAFMGIHNLEFAGAWGVADYVASTAE